MSIDDEVMNNSGNRPFTNVLEVNMSRRKVLAGSLATAAGSFFGVHTVGATPGLKSDILRGEKNGTPPGKFGKDPDLVGFKGLTINDAITKGQGGTVPAIAEGYSFQYLIPWGQSIVDGLPSFDGNPMMRPTANQQAHQIGIGHDGMWLFPPKYGNANERGYLAINHEFGRNSHVLGKDDPESLQDVRRSQHAHGVSVVEIAKNTNGAWELVDTNTKQNRRIHVNTPVEFSGPAAGSPLLETLAGNAPAGTVNNCANGFTPWGTYLTCEENFNAYFGANDEFTATEEQARYGLNSFGFGYNWFAYEDRFDLSNPNYKNEENRFGWVVEIDPYDNTSTPVKRTALGRVKHESIALTVGKGGRVVGYMGDDQRFDYIYKFVSADNWKSMKARGVSPLDEGKLYVAKFNDDGTGDWLELTISNPVLAARFSNQAEVLVYARIAADLLGATPMDRPEWTTVAADGQVYITLTNNSRRGVGSNPGIDAANPVLDFDEDEPDGNQDGHIIRWTDSHKHTGTTFKWEIFLLARDQRGKVWTFTDPDCLWADPDGRLFIQTDGGQPDGLQDQMVVADTSSDELLIKRLFMGVANDEITGIAVTPDRKTMFVNIQHPGDGDPTLTNIPAPFDGVTIPRDCTIVITKDDGGIIGS